MKEKTHGMRTGLAEALIFALAALLFALMLIAPLAVAKGEPLTADEQQLLTALERGELVRLHILADGDDAESQRVKLSVRDAILAAFGDTLAKSGATSADAAFDALSQNVDAMHEVALACARENGFGGSVRAEVGTLWLPEKRYGQALLPEGEYRALRVTLGSGAGQNWWCVLFPQLCLAVAEDGEGAASRTGDEPPMLAWDTLRVLECWTAMPF